MIIKNNSIDKKNCSIVLTATIIPNSNFVVHSNPDIRKNEYLKAIHYYRKFAHVFFLENSQYNILADPNFKDIDNVTIYKIPISHFYHKGKGFQEFQMLDYWIKHEKDLPNRFIKISGRYLVRNFSFIFNEAVNRKKKDLIIDKNDQSKTALTQLFVVKTDFYKKFLMNIFYKCNDENGMWIEKVLYATLSDNKNSSTIFINRPIYEVVSGSTGFINSEKNYIKIIIKQAVRLLFYLLDHKSVKKY